MKIDQDIKIRVLPGVYPPADDSYLLIESINIEKHEKALDMGCGTGIVALHLAKSGLDVVAADISEKAIENTILNSEINNIRLRVVKTDLFRNIDERFDLITFNPPYLPTKGEDISWDGGKGGVEVIDRFLGDAWRYLESGGEIYMVMSSLTNREFLEEKYNSIYEFEVITKRHIFFEDLYSYKISLRNNNSLYP
ncbi:MAG TPA: methyltransferase domain-containing protein [Thermoplasmatales archaeon]|nr:methyltransferase domain-containing protein [Thermoplasmatales archaeon]